MRCLIIIPGWFSGSGACSRAVAKVLVSQGYETWLLTKEPVLDSEFRVYSYFKRGQQKQSRIWLSMKRVIMYPVWPLFSILEFARIYKCAKKIIQEQSIDTLITVYNPIESLMAGHLLKKKMPRLKFVPYFLDALYAGSTPRFMPRWLKEWMAMKWENRLLSNADFVVMMKAAEPIYKAKQGMFENYHKIKFLDLPLYVPRVQNRVEKQDRAIFPKNQTVLLFAGALPLNVRNPQYLLEVMKQISSEDVHLYLVGSGDYDKMINCAASESQNIHYWGMVDYNEIGKMYAEADILVNIGNTLSNMVPSKIFEYMSYEKPIISTVKIDKDPSLPYLRKYAPLLLLDEKGKAGDSATRVLDFIQDNHTQTNVKTSEDPFYLNRPEAFVNKLTELYGKETA